MALSNQSIVTSSIISATSQHKRDYSERIRRLYPSITKFLALVKGSNLDAYGKVAYDGRGMIGKKEAKRMDPEWATYTPIDVFYTATGGSSTTAVIADTSAFGVDDVICNTTTGDVAIVNTIETDTTTLTVTAVTGSTFNCAAGDVIVMLPGIYEEGTSRYLNRTNELTTNKTYLQIFREAVSIADTVKNTPQYTDEGMLERYMTDSMATELRKLEAAFMFSKQGTSGTTAVTIGSTAYTLYSMKGLLSYAGTALDMQGGFNWETFNTYLYPIMPQTINTDETVYMVCGRKIAATMNQWANNKYITIGNDGGKKFGLSPRTYIMGGALEIEPLVHNLFDNGAYANSAVFFQNSDLVYRFMTGLDIKVRENAQLPATMGQTNIIEGVVGLQSWSNGASVKLITNLLAA
jgi:hypothetical protein